MLKGIAVVSTIIVIAEVTGLATGLAFGQVTLAENLPVKFDINNLTAVGVLAWYAWHNAAKVLPKMVADNRAQVSELTKDFLVEQTRATEDHRATMKALTERYMSDLAGERRQFGEMLERERKQLGEMIERERNYHNEQMGLLRERVHDMAGQLQESMLQVINAIDQVAKIGGVLANGKKEDLGRKHTQG